MKRLIYTLAALALTYSAQAQLDRSIRPEAAEPRVPTIAKYESFKLKNGMTVLVVENHKLPRVSVRLNFITGEILEGDKSGALSLMGELMSEGTITQDKATLDERVDFIGASLSTGSRSASVSGLSKYTEELFAILADVARNPAMPEASFDKLKSQTMTGLKTQKDNPDAIEGQVFAALLYGADHPSGEMATEATVENISVADCRSMYDAYWKPSIAVLTIVGDVNVDDVKDLANKSFGDWEGKYAAKKKYKAPKLPTAARIALVNRDGSVQSNIRVGNIMHQPIGHKDNEALAVMNQILGAGSAGRLFQNLREDKAYTYGAYSSYGRSKYTSGFSAGAKVRNAVTDSAVEQLLYEMHRIQDELVSAEELAAAKANLAGGFGRALENPGTVSAFAYNTLNYKLKKNYYNGYLSRLDAVTAEDVQRVAKKYLQMDYTTIVIVGKATEIGPGLERLGIPIEYYDSQANPTEKPIVKEVDPSMTAAKVVRQYFQALCGQDSPDGVLNSFQVESKASVMGMSIKSKFVKSGDNRYQSMKSPMGNQEVSLINGELKQVVRGEVQAMGAEEEAAAMAQLMYFEELQFTDESMALRQELESFNDQACYVIDHTDADGQVVTYYYNVETGLRAGSAREVETPQGETAIIKTLEFDYQEINGFMIPHEVHAEMGPGMVLEFKTTTAIVNGDVDTTVFE